MCSQVDIADVSGDDIMACDSLIIGAPTWHTGADSERSGTELSVNGSGASTLTNPLLSADPKAEKRARREAKERARREAEERARREAEAERKRAQQKKEELARREARRKALHFASHAFQHAI